MSINNLKTTHFKLLTIVLVLSNCILFILINSIPIHWLNPEVIDLAFFWSIDNFTHYNLHTGLIVSDLLKPFDAHHIENFFRMRQFSSLIEMLSFKAHQTFNTALFRNYAYIVLHILNILLLGKLTTRLTSNKRASIIIMILALNTGIALSTLLYPFRIPKILVLTIFLCAWILIANKDKRFNELPRLQFYSFFGLILLMFMTDEIAIFLTFFLGLFLFIKEGGKNLWQKRTILTTLGLSLIYVIVYNLFMYLNTVVAYEQVIYGGYNFYLHHLVENTFNLTTYKNILQSFFIHFLPNNFGFWNISLLGIISLICFISLIAGAIITRKTRLVVSTVIITFSIIFIKTLLLPHVHGHHSVIMPEDTFFASLLYFGYYYTYGESLLACLVIGLCLEQKLNNNRIFVFALLAITLINISNIYTLRNGPTEVLEHFKTNTTKQKAIYKQIQTINAIQKNKELIPIYLSFQAGNEFLLKDNRKENYLTNQLGKIFVTKYLKALEENSLIVPYRNASKNDTFANSKTFYDFHQDKLINLSEFHNSKTWDAPRKISSNGFQEDFQTHKKKYIVFFIQGNSTFELFNTTQKITHGQQTYGVAFQKFVIPLDPNNEQITLKITPHKTHPNSVLIGPFLIDSPKWL